MHSIPFRLLSLVSFALILCSASLAPAQGPAQDPAQEPNSTQILEGESPTAEPLLIGVKTAEPFVIETESGVEGISIELWRRIAEAQNLTYEFEVTSLDGLLEGVETGKYAAGVAATTVTADREEVMDFTHPFFNGGLAIAVTDEGTGLSVIGMLRKLISPGFLTAVAALAVVLLGVGLLVWLAERRANPDQFGGNPAKGLGSGFWFSAVTMTTVGYGDKAPVSPLGRVLALVWMFASIIIISFFTGAIASAFTTSQLEGRVTGPKDLPGADVGAVEGSAAQEVLSARGVRARRYTTVDEGLEALESGAIDAFVHDEPILRFRTQQAFQGEIRVLEATFEPQPYAIALPDGSPLREAINLSLLETITGDDWDRVVERYIEGD